MMPYSRSVIRGASSSANTEIASRVDASGNPGSSAGAGRIQSIGDVPVAAAAMPVASATITAATTSTRTGLRRVRLAVVGSVIRGRTDIHRRSRSAPVSGASSKQARSRVSVSSVGLVLMSLPLFATEMSHHRTPSAMQPNPRCHRGDASCPRDLGHAHLAQGYENQHLALDLRQLRYRADQLNVEPREHVGQLVQRCRAISPNQRLDALLPAPLRSSMLLKHVRGDPVQPWPSGICRRPKAAPTLPCDGERLSQHVVASDRSHACGDVLANRR